MASFGLNLPPINGNYTVGIAAGIDEALPESQRLEVPTLGTGPDATTIARAQMVLLLIRKHSGTAHESALPLYTGAALGLFDCGYIREHRGKAASDWLYVDTSTMAPATDPEKAQILKYVSAENAKIAMHLVAATKVNWWKENHHVGQGELATYVKKNSDVFCVKTTPPIPDHIRKETIHQIGHWGPTRTILAAMGIDHILVETAIVNGDPANGITAAADADIRVKSNPAGTAKASIALAGLNKLSESIVIVLCPQVDTLGGVVEDMKKIMAAPAKFHIGAEYLTGQVREQYSDSKQDNILGRIGTYIATVMPKSTLAASPHIKGNKYQTYTDYSADFETELGKYQSASARAKTSAAVLTGTTAGQAGYEALILAMGKTANPRIIAALQPAP